MLHAGGYLLVGRTTALGVNHATIFLFNGSHFSRVVDYNSGSEISDLILSV